MGTTVLGLVLVGLGVILNPAQCKETASGPGAVAIGQRYTIKSTVLGETRPVLIHLPAGYPQSKNRHYPVIYILDGASNFGFAAAIVDHLVEKARAIPPHIVVGIPNPSRDDRGRDFDITSAGGAKKFSKFLETELLPWVDSHYRTNSYRILFGHSLAGLYTLYVLSTKPALFNAYFAASPWLPANEKTIREALLKDFASSAREPKHLFLTVGSREKDLSKHFDDLLNLLNQHAPDSLAWHSEILAGERHMTVSVPTLRKALMYLYRGYYMKWDAKPVKAGYRAVKSYYQDLGNQVGFNIPIPDQVKKGVVVFRILDGKFNRAKSILGLKGKPLSESWFSWTGGYALRNNHPERALVVFEKYIKVYPNQPKAYGGLAHALEAAGKLEAARDAIDKACELAKDQGDIPDLKLYRQYESKVARELNSD